MRKKLSLLRITSLIAISAVCGVFLNIFLSENNFFIYATGTKDKAFLNTTWKMSPREIERANKTSLSSSESLLLFTPEVTNKSRFKALVQKNAYLWGRLVQVEYSFFDDMLYEYYISLTAYDLEKPHNEILATLTEEFGVGKEIEEKRADLIHSHEWDTEKQLISYWMGKNEGEKFFYIGIRAVNKPFYKNIEEIAKNERKVYF
jgi:hypothetical protein